MIAIFQMYRVICATMMILLITAWAEIPFDEMDAELFREVYTSFEDVMMASMSILNEFEWNKVLETVTDLKDRQRIVYETFGPELLMTLETVQTMIEVLNNAHHSNGSLAKMFAEIKENEREIIYHNITQMEVLIDVLIDNFTSFTNGSETPGYIIQDMHHDLHELINIFTRGVPLLRKYPQTVVTILLSTVPIFINFFVILKEFYEPFAQETNLACNMAWALVDFRYLYVAYRFSKIDTIYFYAENHESPPTLHKRVENQGKVACCFLKKMYFVMEFYVFFDSRSYRYDNA